MALSLEQKEANKAAKKLRDAAFRDRMRAYQKEQKIADETLVNTPERKAMDVQCSLLETRLDEREVKLATVKQQIADLQSQLQQIEASEKVAIDSIKVARDTAQKSYFSLRQRTKDEIESRFQDLADARYSAAGWKPIAEFVEAQAAR